MADDKSKSNKNKPLDIGNGEISQFLGDMAKSLGLETGSLVTDVGGESHVVASSKDIPKDAPPRGKKSTINVRGKQRLVLKRFRMKEDWLKLYKDMFTLSEEAKAIFIKEIYPLLEEKVKPLMKRVERKHAVFWDRVEEDTNEPRPMQVEKDETGGYEIAVYEPAEDDEDE